MPHGPLCFSCAIADQSPGCHFADQEEAVISTEGGALAAAAEKSAFSTSTPDRRIVPPGTRYAPEASLAITSISTSASFGSPATATVDRAGATAPSGARYFA